MSRRGEVLRGLAVLAAGAFCLAGRLEAQGSCTVNSLSTCIVGGTAAAGLTVTIPTVVRMQMANTVVSLGTATAAEFTAGFGTAVAVPLQIKANKAWAITLSATTATWTGTGPAAWQTKPSSDLQWGLSALGSFSNLAATGSSVGSGAATAGTTLSLHLRSRYTWATDAPGSYSLPLQLTITAP